jgi:ribosomal protein S18 acetylase RimI-like enzyme
MRVRVFQPDDETAVIALWGVCDLIRPWNDPQRDIARKLLVQPELFLVGEIDGDVMASAMAGYDGHRGCVYYVAVAPAHQGGGHGRALMGAVEARLLALGCPKVNLQIRTTNRAVIEFYERIGYRSDEVEGYGKRLIPDD